MRERVRLAQVFAVTRGILRDQYQLFHAFFGELMRFGDDRAKPPATKMATHLWNKTKCTRTVAAFGDFDERIMAGRREHARRRFIVEISRALITQGNDRE